MKYTAKYFKDSLPAAKNRQSSVLGRLFHRPVSFWFASIAANLGITANAVSYFSVVVAIAASVLFIINNYACHIIGALLVIFWLILDGVDGNLARGVKKQPFGEFADAMGSYILVGLICNTIGFAAYFEGGLLIPAGCPYIILMGALASSADSLMRLIYQKYKSGERELADQGVIKNSNGSFKDVENARSLPARIEFELGIAGILQPAILLASIFHALDLIVIYCFCYYGGSCIVMVLVYVRKAVKAEKL